MRQKPFDEPHSREFFEALKENDVVRCLYYLKANPKLAQDCDMDRKTAFHWACHLDQANMCQVLIDYGANMFAKDDFSKKPYDELTTTG